MSSLLFWIILIVLLVGVASISAVIAYKKGYNPILYFFLGLILPPWLIIVVCQKDLSYKQTYKNEESYSPERDAQTALAYEKIKERYAKSNTEK